MQLPNLELLEYKVTQLLLNNEEFKERFAEAKKKQNWCSPKLRATLFCQTWSSTCTGFDIDKDGNAMWGGQAFTDEYTTVFHEENTDIYIVCFGNRPCYMVTDAPKEFFEDLHKHRMVSLSESMEKYNTPQKKGIFR